MRHRGGRRRWRRARSLSALVALAAVAASCGASGADTTQESLVPVQGGTVTVGIDASPSTCNPDAAGHHSWASEMVLGSVLPSAFVTNNRGQSTGNQDLALQAELTSTSPQTVVYTLNPKAVWSDGVPITAADFRYAWQQQRGTDEHGVPVVQPGSSLGYRDIRSVTGSNHGKTVTVVFDRPFADWQLLFHDLLPAHVMEQVGWNPPCNSVTPAVDLSGGPFELSSVEPGREVVLTANPQWWGTPPLVDRIVVRVADGPVQLARWLHRGEVQVAQPSSFDPAVLQQLAGNPRTQSQLDVSSTFLQLLFDTSSPLTRSPAVRRAIAFAIDRQDLVDELAGWADANIVPAQSHLYAQDQSAYPSAPSPSTPAPNAFVGAHESGTTTTTSPAASATTDGSVPWPTVADPLQVTTQMYGAGFVQNAQGQWLDASGQPVAVRLVVDEGDPWAARTGMLAVRQLERAGFTVTASGAPSASAAGAELAAGDADVALLPFAASPYPSQAIAWYTEQLGPPGQNGSADWSGYQDPQVSSLLTKASQLLNPVTAQPVYAEVDQLLWNQMVGLPLFAEPTVTSWSSRVTGLAPNAHGPDLLWSAAQWELQAPEPVAAGAVTSSPAS